MNSPKAPQRVNSPTRGPGEYTTEEPEKQVAPVFTLVTREFKTPDGVVPSIIC
jgi:hypothetical protein